MIYSVEVIFNERMMHIDRYTTSVGNSEQSKLVYIDVGDVLDNSFIN